MNPIINPFSIFNLNLASATFLLFYFETCLGLFLGVKCEHDQLALNKNKTDVSWTRSGSNHL